MSRFKAMTHRKHKPEKQGLPREVKSNTMTKAAIRPLLVVLLILVLCWAPAQASAQVNQEVHTVTGKARINGATPPAGTSVNAMYHEQTVGETLTDHQGGFVIEITRAEGPVTFLVAGVSVKQRLNNWIAGVTTRMDLDANSSAPRVWGYSPPPPGLKALRERQSRGDRLVPSGR